MPEGIPAVLRVWVPDREAELLVECTVGGDVLIVQGPRLAAGAELRVSLPVVAGVAEARCALTATGGDGRAERREVPLRWAVGPAPRAG